MIESRFVMQRSITLKLLLKDTLHFDKIYFMSKFAIIKDFRSMQIFYSDIGIDFKAD